MAIGSVHIFTFGQSESDFNTIRLSARNFSPSQFFIACSTPADGQIVLMKQDGAEHA